MQDFLPDRWTELQDAFALPDSTSLLTHVALLCLGGGLAMYLRFLYRVANPRMRSDSIARVFPLLTMVTIAVIAVVKSSLALSLGLVGALSIVRFRAAIKDPEELVYLFLCIGVGLSLGAVQVWLAVTLVVVATVFALFFDRIASGKNRSAAILTVVGEAAQHFGAGEKNAITRVRKTFPSLTVDRCDVEGDEGQLRVQLHRVNPDEIPEQLAELREALPGCAVSWVNADRLP